jgi:hypothetical protein
MAAAAANNLGASSNNPLPGRLPVLRRVSSSCLGCGEDLERQGLFRTPVPSAHGNDGLPWGVVDIDNMEVRRASKCPLGWDRRLGPRFCEFVPTAGRCVVQGSRGGSWF